MINNNLHILLVFGALIFINSCVTPSINKIVQTKTYLATFYDASNNVTQVDTLIYKVYDEKFLLVQQKISWEIIRIKKPNGNTEIRETNSEITGLVISKEEVWLHPPRLSDYWRVTEYAPFPKVEFPLVDGSKYFSKLQLGTYANNEIGSEINAEYKVEKVEFDNWKITGISQTKLGLFKIVFIYNEKNGFTNFHYSKPNFEQLIIKEIITNH